jgi:2-polyprenyl-3-methyl-5-hydroxy-6-metoxy-1,4-benzoquinol methylase/uncharacterized protein YbaR (Trm112 family)
MSRGQSGAAPDAGASAAPIANWVMDLLACPRHGHALSESDGELVCPAGDRFPVVDGIPVLLRAEVRQTHPVADRSLADVGAIDRPAVAPNGREVDPFVQQELLATNGHMYRPLVGRLTTYPIPAFRLEPHSAGDVLLDVGCNWGRWSVAAARAGFVPVGIDPSLEAVRAARRVARQLNVKAEFLVADARYLPFRADAFDVVHSYSVWQHFAKDDAREAIAAASRVVKPGGRVFVQMANAFGLRGLYHQARRGFRLARNFEVRYWSPKQLRQAFAERVGPTRLSVDGFFTLNAQPADLDLLPGRFRWVVRMSERLRSASAHVPWLIDVADSLYITAMRAGGVGNAASISHGP